MPYRLKRKIQPILETWAPHCLNAAIRKKPYANFNAQRSGAMDSGFLRFWGTVELHESGPIREAIFAKLTKREQEHAGADTGIGVLVKIDRALDLHGKPLI